ncbi:MAG: glycoside hydrolase family 36 N-terminal domain-containing protein, partial [Eubacteriales bacterium]|nr:glycoside hydrolase family 36 N-terminal domain-containing protein [Eubacteriales bacterium]
MSIKYYDESKLFKIDTPNITYAIEICGDGKVVNLHFGGAIPRVEDLPKGEVWKSAGSGANSGRLSGGKDREEYCGWGELFFSEPCLKAEFSDHVRDLRLVYKCHKIYSEKSNSTDSEVLIITLADMHYPVEVDAVYRIYKGMDVIDRNAVIRNTGSEDSIRIENMQSASWYVPKVREYTLTHLSGRWGREYQIEKIDLTQSKIVLESRAGVSGANATPWFAVDEGGKADEYGGRVWFGALHWSGNWRISVEKDCMMQLRITGGVNDFDFSYSLKPGESVQTPVFTGGYTTGGFGQASRILHNYQRDYLMQRNKAYIEMPVIYNA